MAGLQNRQDLSLLYLVSEDWYFCSHRLVLAKAARDAGYDVTVVTRVTDHGELIREAGLRLVPFDIRRGGTSPPYDLLSLIRLTRLYRQLRPTLVHHVALKPVIYGSIAARLSGTPCVVNALAGLGYVFASETTRAKLLRPLVLLAFRLFVDGERSRVIVQNGGDRATLVASAGIDAGRIALIRGAGVDMARFVATEEPAGVPVVALVSRMLRDKGVEDFVQAARLLRQRGKEVRCVLVGSPDPDNPRSVSEGELRGWHESGLVEWWGYQDNVAGVWARAHVGVLPTYYGEGIPKSLLEACAAGRPVVATDVPGCRELVEDGKNGLLVPPKSPGDLAEAIVRLLDDREMRKRMGTEGRLNVERGFTDTQVVSETLALYEQVIEAKGS